MAAIIRREASGAILALVALLAPAMAQARHQPGPAPAPAVLLDLQLPGAQDARFRSPLVAQGVASLKAGEYAKAAAAFSEALRNDPQNAYLHFLNGLAYHLMARAGDESQGDLAETGYRQALQFDPNAWWAAYGLALLETERRNYQAAQDDFARVLLIDRDNGGAMHGLAVASYYLGDLELADTAVSRALAKRPDDRAVLRSAALIAAANGEPDRAKALAARYAALEPQAFRSGYVESRIADWALFRASNSSVTPSDAALAEALALQARLTAAGPRPPVPAGSSAASAATDPADKHIGRQVLVDVVYVRSQDTVGSTQGVNLLRGLQLQYAYQNTQNHDTLPSNAPGYLREAGALGTVPQLAFGRAITQAIGIPAVTYSLNIFNSETTHNEVVARPTLIAQEGSASSFFSGDELNIGLVGQLSASLSQLEVGLTLEITPILVADDRVSLTVMVKRTGFDETPAGTFTQAVQTTNNHVSATVTLGYDQTLILTGLTDREKSTSNDRTPFLGEVPGLQYLFRQKIVADNYRSVLIMLTPHRPTIGLPEVPELGGAGAAHSANVAALKQRWAAAGTGEFRPRANLAAVLYQLRYNEMFRELRAGDLTLEDWEHPDSLSRAVREDLQFLYF
jgi:general secretion pathway protein D